MLTRSKSIKRVSDRRRATLPRWQRSTLAPESPKRKAQRPAREACRRVVLARDVTCRYPGCPRKPTDVHELRSRAQGGSPHDPANAIGLCREHHMVLHERPADAVRLGLVISRKGAA